MRIGVIADTHGLLRRQVFEAFDGVDLILHAGDVGSEEVLNELEAVAPVQAVFGNIDVSPLAERLPEKLILELEGVPVFMTHIGGRPERILETHPEARQAAVVIFGHSHKPYREWRQGKLFLNPGAAGPRRFRLPVTLGELRIHEGGIEADIFELDLE